MRFSIRDVIWLTVVIAIGVAWWVDRRNITDELARERKSGRQVLDVLSKLGFAIVPETKREVMQFTVPAALRDRLGETVTSDISN